MEEQEGKSREAEEARAKALAAEAQRKAELVAAQAKARGTKPGDDFAQGVVDNLLHSVKSGFKDAFVAQVQVAGEGKAVNTGIQVADTFFAKDEVRAKLENKMRKAYDRVEEKMTEAKVDMRTACYILALEHIQAVYTCRGIWP